MPGRAVVRWGAIASLAIASAGTVFAGQWVQGAPPFRGRDSHAMAYDSLRSRIVMFGGQDSSTSPWTLYNDTWDYDGSAWIFNAPVPPGLAPRWGAYMVFDSVRGRSVLFGGTDNSSGRNDTWEYDGAAWI